MCYLKVWGGMEVLPNYIFWRASSSSELESLVTVGLENLPGKALIRPHILFAPIFGKIEQHSSLNDFSFDLIFSLSHCHFQSYFCRIYWTFLWFKKFEILFYFLPNSCIQRNLQICAFSAEITSRVKAEDEESCCSTCSTSSSSDEASAYTLPPRRAYGGVRISYVPNDTVACARRRAPSTDTSCHSQKDTEKCVLS